MCTRSTLSADIISSLAYLFVYALQTQISTFQTINREIQIFHQIILHILVEKQKHKAQTLPWKEESVLTLILYEDFRIENISIFLDYMNVSYKMWDRWTLGNI